MAQPQPQPQPQPQLIRRCAPDGVVTGGIHGVVVAQAFGGAEAVGSGVIGGAVNRCGVAAGAVQARAAVLVGFARIVALAAMVVLIDRCHRHDQEDHDDDRHDEL